MKKMLDVLRKNRQSPYGLAQAAPPSLRPSNGNAFYWVVGLGGVGFTISFIGLLILTHDLHFAFDEAKTMGLTCSALFGLWPLLLWIAFYLKQKKVPDKALFLNLLPFHPLVCLLTLAFLMLLGFHSVKEFLPLPITLIQEGEETPRAHHGRPYPKRTPAVGHSDWADTIDYIKRTHFESSPKYYAEQYASFFLKWLLLALFLHIIKVIALNKIRRKETASGLKDRDAFRLWLGHSTGKLSQLAHSASLLPNQKVSLSLNDASQNILVLGGIGAGKTTGVMHPLLLQLLDQQCGGLIFDIKGDFQQAAKQFAKQTHRTLTLIGPKHCKMDLLEGLTPEVAASFLKSVFLLNSQSHSDPFWIETATELCRNTLGMLSVVTSSYHLQGLYRYLFDLEFRIKADAEIDTALATLDEQQGRQLKAYCHYYSHIFDNFDAKVKAGVQATIAQILSPFNHPELTDTFCTSSQGPPTKENEGERQNVRMEDVLKGAVYLVDLPLATWGLGAKVVYSLIKLRFYNVMQKRLSAPSTNDQKGPVFFMCDEFQEIVSANRDGLSDLNFWDKSRSSKTIGIISAQAVSSFYAAIGDRDVANALLQNFRQKICFKTEDPTTLEYFHRLTDKVEVVRESLSKARGTQSHATTWGNNSTSSSSTENRSWVEKPVLSAQLFRQLQLDQAIALLSMGGKSMDDVLRVMPVYV